MFGHVRPGLWAALCAALLMLATALDARAQAAGWSYFEGELTGVAGTLTVCPYEEGVDYPLPLPYAPKCDAPVEMRTFDTWGCQVDQACYFSDTYASLAVYDGGEVATTHTISTAEAVEVAWGILAAWAGVFALRQIGRALAKSADDGPASTS